jgi:hypothetical protein
MKKHNQLGVIQTAAIVAVVSSVLFVFSLIIAIVFYMGKSDLQKNMDAKVAQALVIETKKVETEKDAELAEKEKSPTKSYAGPSTIGSVTFNYPKTFSAYVEESQSGSTRLNGFFHPNIVPKDDPKVLFALRVQVVSASYESELKSFGNAISSGKAQAKPFTAAAVPDVLGTRIDGEVASGGKQGSLILLPVRDKTLRIWTESKESIPDFDTYVVPSISFVP